MAERTGTVRAAHASYDHTDDPEVIRVQIEETRAHMSETVDAIQDRLAPARLTQEAKDMIKEATKRKVDEMTYTAKRKANNWRHSIVETIKENPLPAALAGIGLGWLFMRGASHDRDDEYSYVYGHDTQRLYAPEYEYAAYAPETTEEHPGFFERAQQSAAARNVSSAQHKAGEMAGQMHDKTKETMDTAQAKVSSAAQTAKETAGNVANSVQEAVSHVTSGISDTAEGTMERTREMGHQARYQARRARRGFEHQLYDNPLAVGAVAVAAGAVVGMMLPSTQKENELMGETRDHLLEQAQTAAKEKVHQVKHVAEEATHAAKETAKEESRKQGLTTTAEKETAREGSQRQGLTTTAE